MTHDELARAAILGASAGIVPYLRDWIVQKVPLLRRRKLRREQARSRRKQAAYARGQRLAKRWTARKQARS